jgi:hypothetical protein
VLARWPSLRRGGGWAVTGVGFGCAAQVHACAALLKEFGELAREDLLSLRVTTDTSAS